MEAKGQVRSGIAMAVSRRSEVRHLVSVAKFASRRAQLTAAAACDDDECGRDRVCVTYATGAATRTGV